MSIEQNLPHLRDVASVGTRVSWGAIWAGSILALALCLLMSTLAGAVGLAVHDKVNAANLETGSIIWALLTVGIALFVGGLLTSLLTVGEDKTEAVMHGVLMWALLLGILLVLGAVGVRGGISILSSGLSFRSEATNGALPARLETARDAAGIPDKSGRESITPPEEMSSENARRLGWYSFAAIWLSMLAAAAGAYAGAGPTFRVLNVSSRTVMPRSN
jgi:hypothetical protein